MVGVAAWCELVLDQGRCWARRTSPGRVFVRVGADLRWAGAEAGGDDRRVGWQITTANGRRSQRRRRTGTGPNGTVTAITNEAAPIASRHPHLRFELRDQTAEALVGRGRARQATPVTRRPPLRAVGASVS